MGNDLKKIFASYREQTDCELAKWLDLGQAKVVSPRLVEAMRYSVFNGGKRVRPALAFAAASAVAGDQYFQRNEMAQAAVNASTHGASKAANICVVNIAAAAVECVHAYSLIHDDLPAMDDDELRRGLPTCHIQFDEATAILAGDALQTLAFEKLSGLDDAELALALVRELSSASGSSGMVAGQMLDLDAEGKSKSLRLAELEQIHRHKTGALICAAVRMGAIAAGASSKQLDALTRYAEAIGLAFQVQDDIIDVCSDTETLGKPQGSDIESGKSTYVALLGLDGAKRKAQNLVVCANEALASAELLGDTLSMIADYIVARQT